METTDRNIGFANGLKGHLDMEIVAHQHCNYLQENAPNNVEDGLQRFGSGEFDAIYTYADEMAFGAIQVFEEAGRTCEITIVGINGANTAVEVVAHGQMDANFSYPYVAPEGVQFAYKVAKGEAIDKEIVLDSIAVTSANAVDMIGRGY